MNIVQILPELNVGGVETGTVDFAKYLVQHGHRSIVVSNGGELVSELESAGSKHYTLPVHKKSFWTALRMIKALRKIIQDEKIHIVHARSRVPAWIAYFACRKTKASFITTCHGYYKNRIFSQVMGWAKLVIVPSEAIGRHMMVDFKVPSERIRCIARSVDLSKFKISKEKKQGRSPYTIAIVGRITPLKGHRYFIKALAEVVRTLPKIRIWIIGDAPAQKTSYREELEVLVQRSGLKDHVEFFGNRRDIAELLSQTDVLVLSTITQEAFGRVILEAQAMGVPVVATHVGGVVDIIDDGKTGLLVMPKDTEAMAKAVIQLLKDKALANRLTAEAKLKLQEKFTLEQMASRTIEVYAELLNSVNILVIKISSLGDVVLVTASLKAIRKKFPNGKICCLVGEESRKILHNCPYLDGIIIYDHKYKDKGWIKLLKFSHKLRRYQFDKIIDFQNNRKSHLLSFLSFAKESYGFNNGKWSFFLTHPLKGYRDDIPAVAHQFQLLKLLGIPYRANTYLELWPSLKDKQYAKTLLESEWLGSSQNIVGINIAASAKWQTKNWPIEHIARLCDILSSNNIRIIITGLEKDIHLANYLLSLTRSKPANLVGKTDILQLAILIKKCKVFVTPDSAPMHVAAAVQTPCIVFFGPTDSTRHIPPAKKIVVLEKKLTCAPCYSSRCRILTHACMKEISPEEVARKIKEILKDKKQTGITAKANVEK
jgi:lipopolysaccharide heptosyltransferase II